MKRSSQALRRDDAPALWGRVFIVGDSEAFGIAEDGRRTFLFLLDLTRFGAIFSSWCSSVATFLMSAAMRLLSRCRSSSTTSLCLVYECCDDRLTNVEAGVARAFARAWGEGALSTVGRLGFRFTTADGGRFCGSDFSDGFKEAKSSP